MPQGTTATILLVDDSRVNRMLLERRLAAEGYRFLHAENGRKAIEALALHTGIDLILLDLIMPEMDGYEFLQWRATSREAQAIPVIINSSLDDFDSIVQALNMDCYDYFIKPLSDPELKHILPLKIKNAVHAKRLMDRTRRQNRIMKNELEMAARYQQFLLPKDTEVPGVKVEYLFNPCSGVGGDYFDFFNLPGGSVGFVVADVAGHGMASAMTASIVKALLPGYLGQHGSPARALEALNVDLVRLTQEDSFVTCFAAFYDPQRRSLAWSAAGHPPPLLIPQQGAAMRLAAESMFLGVFSDGSNEAGGYIDRMEEVSSGDRLIMYTDGLVEAANPEGRQFTVERLEILAAQYRRRELAELRNEVWNRINEFSGGEFFDDVAFIAVEF